MVTIINNEDLKRLNEGKSINLELGPFEITLASEEWVSIMEKKGVIRND